MLEEHKLKHLNRKEIMMITDFLASSLAQNATLDLGDNLELLKLYDSAHIALKSKISSFYNNNFYFDKENILPNGKVIILNNKI